MTTIETCSDVCTDRVVREAVRRVRETLQHATDENGYGYDIECDTRVIEDAHELVAKADFSVLDFEVTRDMCDALYDCGNFAVFTKPVCKLCVVIDRPSKLERCHVHFLHKIVKQSRPIPTAVREGASGEIGRAVNLFAQVMDFGLKPSKSVFGVFAKDRCCAEGAAEDPSPGVDVSCTMRMRDAESATLHVADVTFVNVTFLHSVLGAIRKFTGTRFRHKMDVDVHARRLRVVFEIGLKRERSPSEDTSRSTKQRTLQ
ncbi:hypothetical protein CYMTET_35679 [Cymbomonas tetramitiformis]|uniref:Uncharacterized protein n=1 Tax=Cymbomonas tetramitiformis TaxID=36881 RepID=A0AAE0F8W3_9CHLO|nr:hypothetical protein CYMTET_35679 [Cymbomonas tetramitiformis]|eukprot:gene296-551_t